MTDEIKDSLAEQFWKTKVILMGFSEFPEDSKIETLPSVKNNLKSLRECFLNPEIMGVPEDNILTIDENSRINNILATLNEQLEDHKDTVIVYYAGHGYIRKDGKLCLANQETKTSDLTYTAINFYDIRNILSRSSAKTKILILDCCYSGRATIMSDALSAAKAQVSEIEGAYIIASAPPNHPAFASEKDKPTIFSGELIDILETGIDNNLPYINVDELFENIHKQLLKKGRPEPHRSIVQHAGKYPFARNRKYIPPPDEALEITFQNQEDELNIIEQTLIDTGKDPFIYIYEPAQMGKTYLLQELEKRYKNREGWQVIYFKLSANSDKPKKIHPFHQISQQLDKIIAQRTGSPSDRLKKRGTETSATLFQRFNTLSINHQERVLILIDNIEFISEELAKQLIKLILSLKEGFAKRTPNYTPGFVIAGRRSFQDFENGYSPSLRRVELSSFTANVVSNLLKNVAHKLAERLKRDDLPDSFTSQWYQERAEEIINCTAGHPGCIAALVRYFYQNEFGVADLNSVPIFRKTVVPIIKEEILKYENLVGQGKTRGVEFDFQRLLRALLELSTYRIIIRPHIEAVSRKLTLKLSPKDLVNLEEELVNCLLVEFDEDRGVYWINASVRQLLFRYHSLDKDIFSMHTEAARYYEELMTNTRYDIGLNTKIIFIGEILYHLSQSRKKSKGFNLNNIQSKLKELSTYLQSKSSVHPISLMLNKRLAKDKELEKTIDTRFGPHAYNELLSILKKKRSNPGGNQ